MTTRLTAVTHHHRLLVLAAGMLLATPALASCGFDYETDQINTNGAGVTDRSGEVDALGVAVVAGQDGSGNVVGTLSNNSITEADSFTSLTGAGEPAVTAAEFEPVEISAGGTVNLADLVRDGSPVSVEGDFAAGDFVELTFEFETGAAVTVEVPVVKPCYQYEGLEATDESSSDDAAAEEEPAAYSCEVPEDAEH